MGYIFIRIFVGRPDKKTLPPEKKRFKASRKCATILVTKVPFKSIKLSIINDPRMPKTRPRKAIIRNEII